MLRTLLVVALIVLSGCVQISGERRAATKNIAIVVAVPDEVSMMKIGVTVFNNSESQDRSAWGFEARIRESLTEALRVRRSDITVVPVQYDPAKVLEKLREPTPKLDVDPNLASVDFKDIVAGKAIDTIFLITPTNDSYNYGSIVFKGVGIEVYATMISDRAPLKPRVYLRLYVIDAPSMKVLASHPGRAEDKMYNLNRLLYPDSQAPAFPAGFTMPLNEAQKAFLQPKLNLLMDQVSRDLIRDSGY